MKQAIEKAIEGGYVYGLMYKRMAAIDPLDAVEVLFLDPKWWKCLGIGLGNKDEMRCDSPRCESKQCEYAGYKDPKRMYDSFYQAVWYGESFESFFKKLLK